ncbi:unnamed protein product [Toxocara canis]|uniref:Uncharacterized protein n=1 Tax=Toxocara canis TaxID=6265 RepID=A0A183U5Q8_TOXCA|nr:unnamed protein product [Toxocara canis]
MGNPKWFDNTSQVDLDYTAAALGGARVLVDQTRTTRSISKKCILIFIVAVILISYCGLKEEEFLYDGLKLNDSELKAVEELNKNRQASVVESFADFQKQIRFKMIVLSHLAEKLAGISYDLLNNSGCGSAAVNGGCYRC